MRSNWVPSPICPGVSFLALGVVEFQRGKLATSTTAEYFVDRLIDDLRQPQIRHVMLRWKNDSGNHHVWGMNLARALCEHRGKRTTVKDHAEGRNFSVTNLVPLGNK